MTRITPARSRIATALVMSNVCMKTWGQMKKSTMTPAADTPQAHAHAPMTHGRGATSDVACPVRRVRTLWALAQISPNSWRG